MEGKPREGLTFLAACADDWSGSYFAIHNWWHRSLFHLELGETDEVLAHTRGQSRGRSTEWLDVVDAAAVLWRLSLFGVDVGEYAEQLAADIDPLVGEPVYLFNDWHAVMVFGLAGHHEDIERVLSGTGVEPWERIERSLSGPDYRCSRASAPLPPAGSIVQST